MKSFSGTFVKILDRLKLSQTEFAAKTGLSDAIISTIVRGVRNKRLAPATIRKVVGGVYAHDPHAGVMLGIAHLQDEAEITGVGDKISIKAAEDLPIEDAVAKLARRGKENDSLKQFIVSLSDILND